MAQSRGSTAYPSTGATKLRRLKERYDAGKITQPIYEALVKKYGGTIDSKEKPTNWGDRFQQSVEDHKVRKIIARDRKETEESLDVKRGKKAWK